MKNFITQSIFSLALVIILLLSNAVSAQVANWTPVPAGTNFPTNLVGQINGMSRVCQMKFHVSNPTKFYAITSQGGLFITTNAGNSWTVAPGTETMTVNSSAVCVDYTKDQNIWLGTGDPNYYSNGSGLFFSNNGGTSFTATSLSNCLVIDVLQNPINAAELVAATNKGIYKSSNSGLTWAATTSTTYPFTDLKSNAAVNSQTLYACTNEIQSKFLRSTDYGSTWTQILNGIVTPTAVNQSGGRIAVTPTSTNVVYFELLSDGGMLFKSNDGGLNFNMKKAGGWPYLTYYSNTVTSSSQGNYNNGMTVDQTNPAKVWIQAHNTWQSLDSGATWTMLSYWPFILHTDMHQIKQSPYNSNDLYSCNDGGVWLSNDGGTNWTQKTNGIFAFEIGNETAVSSLTQPQFVSIGTQDNARLYGNGSGWFTINGGDDYAKRVFDFNGHIYYDGTNRQANHTGSYAGYNLPTANWNCFAFNRTNYNLAFMGFDQIYRSINVAGSAPTWTTLTNLTQSISAIHSCIADPNRLYALSNTGNFISCNNALSISPSFTILALPGGNTSIGSIVAMANNPDVIYVHKNNAVYRSSDGGVSWGTVTYNLPNVNHRRILAEQYGGTQELVMIATNNAVYYKKAGQNTWTNFSSGLPPRKSPTGFSMFDDGTTQARIRYSSYGRGMWESGFDKIRAFSANMNFLTDTTITCYSPNIQVSDGSLGTVNTPLTYTWNFPGGTPATAFTSSASVTYPASGNYTISLTIRDALNNVSTKTVNKFIQVIGCAADTIPGNALQVNGTTNYARTNGALPIGTTNSITLSAWIKINSTQASFAGIIFTGSGGATGLDFRNANQLGYHYNNGAATYNFGGGPTVPLGEWVHVAMVTTAANTILYMNGVPYTSNVANAAVNFNTGFTFGNDRDNSARTMDGQMDEVCIYNRALSQNEIRELMHLTKNYGVIDAGLVGYYQFNEVGNAIYNRAGTMNAVMLGTGQHTLSTAPVGSGTSLRQTINTSGLKLFPNQGNLMAFPGPALPFGEVCVTRLHLQPDSVPNNNFANAAARYWVINNWGNPTFNALNTVSLTGYGNITTNEANAPRKFKLYTRNTGGFLKNAWTLVDSASAATSGTNAALTFTGSGVGGFNKQFTIMKSPCIAPVIGAAAATSTYICVGGTVNLSVAQGTLNDAANWKWYSGACGGATVATGTVAIVSPTTTTIYYLRGEGGCVVNASVCTAITVSVNPSLQISITPSAINVPTALCQASSQVFSVNSIPGAAAYSWTLPSSWIGSSTTNSIAVQIGASGTIGVTASNMCGTSATKTISVVTTQSISSSRSATICAGDKLVVGPQTYTGTGTYSFAIPRQSGCDSLVITNLFVEPTINTGVTVSILDLIANENNATYQWMDCATQQIIVGANSQTYTAQQNGSYAVIVTVNNCSDTSACMQMVEVGIKENGARAAVVIHPNPAQEVLYVNVPVSGLNFKLTNAIGQEILKGSLLNGSNTIRLTGVAEGVYYLTIEGLESKVVRKVVVE